MEVQTTCGHKVKESGRHIFDRPGEIEIWLCGNKRCEDDYNGVSESEDDSMAGKKKSTSRAPRAAKNPHKPRPSQTPVKASTPAPGPVAAPQPEPAPAPVQVPAGTVTPELAKALDVPGSIVGTDITEAGLLPDISFVMTPYEHKPKSLPDHFTIDGLCGNEEFEKAVLRHKQLSITKSSIEKELANLKTILLANMAVAGRDDVAVGRFKVTIVHKGQPTIKKDLLLQNGVSVEVIEKSTVVTPVEYPLVDDMGKPKRGRKPAADEEAE
jgi:hypothetical protein